MEILKGMVRDVGYPDVECTYAKIDDNTIYYFIESGELPNGNVIASTVLKEAIGHAPYTSLGLINKNGDVLIPFENKIIKQIKDKLLLVEKNVPTTQSVVDALKNKSDPFSASKLVETATAIKSQITNAMGMSGDFIFDNQFSEAAIYTMDGINVANGYYSFISECNSDYYFSANVAESQIIKFNPEQLEEVSEQQSVPTDTEENNNATENVQSENQTVGNDGTVNEEEQNSEIKLNIDIPIQNQMANNTTENSEQDLQSDNESSGGVENNLSETENTEVDNEEETEEENTEVNDEEETEEENTEVNDEEETEEENTEVNDEEKTEEENTEVSNEEETEEENTEVNDEEETEEENTEVNDEEETEEENTEVNDEEETEEENTEVNDNKMTTEDISNPVIADATNTIKKLLKENREQRRSIDKQLADIEVLKSNYSILKEEASSKEQEVISLRQELNSYRSQSIDLNRENTKLKSTLMRQSDVMKNLEEQNTSLREQVAGIHALGNAVAEANVLIEPVNKESVPLVNDFDYNKINDSITYGEFNRLDNEKDSYQKTKAS